MTAPGRSESAPSFESFAVLSRRGAHVTPQAGVDLFGRYWTTTSRDSLKRRAIGRRPVASVARTTPELGWLSLTSGRARVLDPASLSTALDDPFATSVAGLVAGRIALTHLDEVIGYGTIDGEIPAPWTMTGRVLLSVADDQTLIADERGIAEATGRWAREHPLPPIRRRTRVGPLQLGDSAHDAAHDLVHDAWHDDTPIRCAVGLSTPVGPVSVPATWDPGHGSAVVRRDVVARLSPMTDAGACITLDRHADRPADEKVGVILRGTPALRALPKSHPLHDDHLGVVVDPDRVTWWYGFASGTSPVGHRAAA